MTLPVILSNKLGGEVLLLFTSNASVNVVGNTVTSDIAVSGTNENVIGLTIKSVLGGIPDGNGSYWTVSRNTTLVGVYGQGNFDYAQHGMIMGANSTQTVVANLFNSTTGSLVLLCKKNSQWTSS